jgi:hypothetical protein
VAWVVVRIQAAGANWDLEVLQWPGGGADVVAKNMQKYDPDATWHMVEEAQESAREPQTK